MKKRDNYIAIFFLLFILVIPAVTFVRGFMPAEESGLTDEQKELLEGNGTYQDKKEEEEVTSEQAVEEVKEPFTFSTLQHNLNEFTNRLFLKTKFIAFNSELVSFISGGTYMSSTQVLAGKNGWLFYKTQNDGFPIYDYMGINHFSDAQLNAAAYNLVETRDALEQRGIKFVATCIPNKEIIYEEYMADTVVRVDDYSRGHQLADYIQNNTDVRFVYPLDELLEAKNNNQLYYRTDTHWNQVGAFVGTNELLKALYGQCDDINSVSFGCAPESYTGDLALIGKVKDKVTPDDAYSFNFESVNTELGKDRVAIVVGDSFGGFMSHVAKGYFEQVEWIYIQDFTWDMIDKYNPDVVIWESVERYSERFTTMSLATKTVPGLY